SIWGGQVPESRDIVVPGDISSAAFWIVAASARDGARLLIDKVRALSGSEGLTAATGVYEDLGKIGVIDAAKVTRSALQNAASIAALFLTTEAIVADKPEKEAAGMGGHDHDF
ncbi:MAG: hypothetical protein ACO307_01495, partial [Ilumatobacteraceae bacterium]